MDTEQDILNDEMDASPMSHTEAAAGRLADRYLLGQLDAAESQRFERHFLTCPECLAELETTEPLIDGLRDAAAEDVGRAALGVAFLARLGRFGRLALYAALLAILIVPPTLLWNRLRALDDELARNRSAVAALLAPQAAVAVLPLNPLREASGGGEPARQIRLGQEPGWVVLALELDRPRHRRYRVTLRHAAGDDWWHGEDLVPDARDVLTLNVHSSSLAAGDHRVEVMGLEGDGAAVPVSSFAFRVVLE